MPTELRRILFHPAELTTAIADYYRRRALPLPDGNVIRTKIVDGESLFAVFSIQDDPGNISELEVPSEWLGAALILYCINRKIPLPVGAEKRLQKVGEDLALVVALK